MIMPQCYDDTGHDRCPGSLGGMIPCECECHSDPTPEQVASVIHAGGSVTMTHGRRMGRSSFSAKVNAELRRLAEEEAHDGP